MNIIHLQYKDFKYITGISKEEFNIHLNNFVKYTKSCNKGRNHTLLSPESKLIFILFFYRFNLSQKLLSLFYRVDQSQVSRWIYEYSSTLEKSLGFIPNMVKRITSIQELEIIIDSTERLLASRNNKYYSGKKKTFTLKHQITIDKHGLITSASKAYPGNIHDFKLFKVCHIPKCSRVIGDSGYQGIQNYHNSIIPYKRPNDKQRLINTSISKIRCVIEHVFAKLKQYKIIGNKLRSISLANTSFKSICCLYNFHRLYELNLL